MFRTILFASLLTMAFASKTVAASYAYVDLQEALMTVEEGKTARAKLEKEFQEKQKMLQAREEEIKKLTADYQKKQLVMSTEKRAQEEGNIQKKMMEYRELMQSAQTQMQKQELELTQPIVEQMRAIVANIAEKEKYDLVYEKNQSGIFYSKEAKDITAAVISQYDAKNKKKKK
jgi:outer membrane protein